MHVRPLLAQHCLECHSAENQKGMLRLDSRAFMLKGGESEESAIVPGRPDKSLLISAVRYESFEMPPKGKLPEKDIAVLAKWIELGAPWPGGEDSRIRRQDSDRFTEEDRKWWAIQPVTESEVPKEGDLWARNDVDRFVAKKLKNAGLVPAREADRYELVRRAYFDLHGLPPTPEQIKDFVRDEHPDAWQRLIRKLLASPRYGERWAQHWLDVVRYADSDGYREDAFRPDASAFRDYVIRSLNDDKPYNQFVREHLAGDEIDPDDPEVFIGTAYLRHGVYEWNQRDTRMHWNLITHEMTRVTGEVFLGIGIGCAQCHDHKFDPILQKDYFGLQAFLSSVAWPIDRPLATPDDIAAHQEKEQKWKEATQAIRDEIDGLVGHAVETRQRNLVSQFPEDIQVIYYRPESEKTTLEKQLSYLVWRQAVREAKSFDHASALRSSPEKLKRYEELKAALKKFDAIRPAPLPTAFMATDIGPEPADTFLPTRTTKVPVEPSFLTLLNDGPPRITPTATTTGRRTALADWIVREDNPLSTRVIVNRIWQRHFGRGIVATPNDFGMLGEPPSHPELLDWLTRRFLNSGWKLKPLHELIMNSAAYRQTARREPTESAFGTARPAVPHGGLPEPPNENAEHHSVPSEGRHTVESEHRNRPADIDPTNRLLWRFPPQRLDAEQLRDAMLAVSGELKHRNGGRSVNGTAPNRSVYVIRKRNGPDTMLCGFDAPLCFESAPDRIATTTPVQSLLLVNGSWSLDRSRAFAQRLLADEKRLAADDIRKAWRLVFGREAREEEVTDALAFIREQSKAIQVPADETGLRPVTEHFGAVKDFGLGTKALWIQPESRFERLHLKNTDGFSDQFTFEAVTILDRIYPDATANTLISRWNGNSKADGWKICVTSAKSAYQPRNFVVALVGRTIQDETVYEVVASGLRYPLNKPVYLAAAISAAPTNDNPAAGSVTFYMKDLSSPDSELQISKVATSVIGRIQNPAMKLIAGGRDSSSHFWDGQFARLTISHGALPREQLLIGSESDKAVRILDWKFNGDDGEHPAPETAWLRRRPEIGGSVASVETFRAVTDFCHALFNSNEFLYLH
ncbi:MAG: PSD1 and planctomycete cytochrome C domain-containing protein [Fuerstiella sp.]